MSSRFAGKVVLITGGATGIGRQLVTEFLGEGAKVCVADLNQTALAELSLQYGASIATAVGDVRNPATHQEAVSQAEKAFGRLDVLVGNAGVFDGYAKLQDITPEQLASAADEMFAINVKGYLLAAQAAIPALLRSEGNMVFTVSSSASYSETGGTLYAASKAAVAGMIRQLAYDLAPVIRVNGVSPGGTQTGLAVSPALRGIPSLGKKQSLADSEEDRIKRAQRRSPLGRVMRPEDHTPAYLFLASNDARMMTGTVVQSDGGLGARGIEHVAGGSALRG